MLESIFGFIKEYDYLFTVVFSAIAALFAILSYFQSKRNEKVAIRHKIDEKRAIVIALENSMKTGGDYQQMQSNHSKITELNAEIKQLEKQL